MAGARSDGSDDDAEGDAPFASGLARRDAFMADVPSWYRGGLHVGALQCLGLAGLAAALVGIRHVRPVELLVAPVSFLVANFLEWWVHRGPLHHRAKGPARVLYDRHTRLHHAAFSEEEMAIRSARELRMVLFPLPALLGAALVAGGLALPLAWLWSENAARIFFVVALGYYLLYEWCHLSFHLPSESFVGRRAIVRWLRRNHARHHDPRLMRERNFNVTFPIADRVMGTLDRG